MVSTVMICTLAKMGNSHGLMQVLEWVLVLVLECVLELESGLACSCVLTKPQQDILDDGLCNQDIVTWESGDCYTSEQTIKGKTFSGSQSISLNITYNNAGVEVLSCCQDFEQNQEVSDSHSRKLIVNFFCRQDESCTVSPFCSFLYMKHFSLRQQRPSCSVPWLLTFL